MEFLLLGPLEVRRDGQAVEVRGAKRRTLLSWFQGASTWTFVARKGQPSNRAEPERYSTGIAGSVPPEVPTTDTIGALRAKRVGKYLTTYYRWHGTWVKLGTAYAAGVVRLLFGLGIDPSLYGRQPVVVAFDNFRATASDEQYSVECQGVPYPPRRPPP